MIRVHSRWLVTFSVVLLVLAGCTPAAVPSFEQLPRGDASTGKQLFNQSVNGTPPCATCHTLDGSVKVGPSLQGFSSLAPTRVSDMSAEQYTFQSIIRSGDFLVEGFSNTMYPQYGQQLSEKQIADLIAYLLTL